ncbi:MAG TPA: cytochrome c-type biogenesis protein CcmH [Gaiellaceae bacterium]|nr:cytochrome c-type biogenesis protein CcmH [Gaiellaceae bacterium]
MRALALAVAALVLAAPAWAGSRPNAAAIETKLVCPVCHETLDQSTAPIAQQMKSLIRKRIRQGWSEQQILDEMVANFGPGVLSTPAKHGFDLLAWVLPLGGVMAGVVVLGFGARHWSRVPAGPASPGTDLDPEIERRIDEELERFDD